MLKKNQIFKVTGLIISCAVISACDTSFDKPVGDVSYSNGTADFSKFVSIGDSLTAGYADNALYLSGQENSYPAILAQQFAKVGGGSFAQPLVSDNLGGLLIGGNENSEFGNRYVLNAETKSPEPITGTPTTEVTDVLPGPFNNMGVPGAKSFHLLSTDYGDQAGLGAGTANPYFVRFASATNTTMIADAAAQLPSFFVIWVGNNDVLSYATSGGIGTDQRGNINPATYSSSDITDPTAFAGIYTQLVSAFTTANADVKGVLINIPDISTLPYFKTVPYNAVPLDQTNADDLNAAYTAYNKGVTALLAGQPDEVAKRTITFAAGQNAVVISDEDLTDLSGSGLPSMRQATANDLLVLTSSSKIGTPKIENDQTSIWGLGVPLEDADVLIPSEIELINTARLAFNNTIKTTADANDNLLFVDIEAIMAELSTTAGIDYGTGSITAIYATGGGFSLDGVHPTARAYSVIANRIITTINTGFSANIPAVDPGNYTTIFVK